jgi:hypothetical protein
VHNRFANWIIVSQGRQIRCNSMIPQLISVAGGIPPAKAQFLNQAAA